MHSQATSSPDQLQQHSAARKVQFLRALSRLEFSGQLIWSDAAGHHWTLFLNLGRVVYGTGGVHSIKRWRRHLATWYPQLKSDIATLENELSNTDNLVLPDCWEYQILYIWLRQKKISEDNAARIIQDILIEILFDIAQTTEVTHQIQRGQPRIAEFTPIRINEEEVFTSVHRLWHTWYTGDLQGYCPNLAPSIQEPELIQSATSPQTYRALTALLTGRYSLWDIAVKTQRDLVQITQALKSYIQLGWVTLTEIADEPPPSLVSRSSASDVPLIACIDDSRTVCASMEVVIKGAGYEFMAVMEPSRAIAALLANKPDLIFLDLIMPETNGYNICSYLRKLSLLKDTPIVILSGVDGVVDQVRARLLGASDFLSKPMQPDEVLSMIHKHLGQVALR
jgi:two-component system, chemotaxis family, response regulator PixG